MPNANWTILHSDVIPAHAASQYHDTHARSAGKTNLENDGAWTSLRLDGAFVGEMCGSTTGEAEALAGAIVARWNACADALAELERWSEPVAANRCINAAAILRAALAEGRGPDDLFTLTPITDDVDHPIPPMLDGPVAGCGCAYCAEAGEG